MHGEAQSGPLIRIRFEDVGSLYTTIYVHNLYGLYKVMKSYSIYLIYVWKLIVDIVLRQGENIIVLIPDIEDQNTTYVFASKGT